MAEFVYNIKKKGDFMRKNLLYSEAYRLIIYKLTEERKRQKKDQSEIAYLLGQPPKYISRVETFDKALNIEELFDYCDALNIDVLDLIHAYRHYLKKLKK